VHVDECGAPERFTGSKLLALPAPGGKLTPDVVSCALVGFGDQHHVQPRVLSITQSSELGTVYEPQEIRALADHVHAHGMLLHVDGSRIANAAAGLGVELRAITTDAGVDALSFGATKNGAMGVETAVLLREDLARDFRFIRKRGMQLASKMRLLSAQLEVLLDSDLWRRNAEHANAMAQRLAAAVGELPGVHITQPVQANAVFAILPPGAAERLQEQWRFYTWDESTGEVRWMCAWDTPAEEVDAFAADVARVHQTAEAGSP
jgi:threonine aldolase